MSSQTIRAGHHEPRFGWPWLRDRLPWLCRTGQPEWSRRVTFTDSCRYALPGIDQVDVNKLGGLAFGLTSHHVESVRVGWSYNPALRRIEIYAYAYVGGQRVWEECAWPNLGTVNIGQPVDVRIRVRGSHYLLDVRTPEGKLLAARRVDHHLPVSRRRWGRGLGLYFGGNRAAPQDVEVLIW